MYSEKYISYGWRDFDFFRYLRSCRGRDLRRFFREVILEKIENNDMYIGNCNDDPDFVSLRYAESQQRNFMRLARGCIGADVCGCL